METGIAAAISGATVLLTLVFREGIPAILRAFRDRKQQEIADRRDTISEWRQLMDRIDQDRAKCEEDSRQLRADALLIREENSRLQRVNDRLQTEIEVLQEALEKAGIPFKRRVLDGSHDHTPLPNAIRGEE